MKIIIRELNENDNNELLLLCSLRNTGTELFTIDRSPSFFNFSKTIGHKARYYGAFIDGQLLGCGGLTLQNRKSENGQSLTAGYIHDLRTHPKAPISIIRKLIEIPFSQYASSCDFIMANILDDNKFLRGFLEKRKMPMPFSMIPSISAVFHNKLNLVKRNEFINNFDLIRANKTEAFKYWAENSPPFSLIEECLFDEVQSSPYFIKNSNNKIIALFNIIDQGCARNYTISHNQKISVKYISNICGILNNDEILKIAIYFVSENYQDHFIAFSDRKKTDTSLISTYMKSNILIWEIEKNRDLFSTNHISMDLNEI